MRTHKNEVIKPRFLFRLQLIIQSTHVHTNAVIKPRFLLKISIKSMKVLNGQTFTYRRMLNIVSKIKVATIYIYIYISSRIFAPD